MFELAEDIFRIITSHVSGFVQIGRSIAALGMFFVMGQIVVPTLLRQEPLDVSRMMKPMFFFLLLLFYPQFVGGLHYLVNRLGNSIEALADGISEGSVSYEEVLISESLSADDEEYTSREIDLSSYNIGDVNTEDEKSDNHLLSFKFSFGGLGRSMANSLLAWSYKLLRFLALAITVGIYILRTIILSILFLLGPLVIGLSYFPIFSESIVNWLSTYIKVGMWYPISEIILMVMAILFQKMANADGSLTTYGENAFGVETFLPGAVAFIFLLVSSFAILAVPYMASLVIAAGGGSAIGKAIKTRMLQAATGGASAASRVASSGRNRGGAVSNDAN